MRTPPKGYASTAVWERFNEWADSWGIAKEDHRVPGWEHWWPPFRDGYSAGIAEEDK